MATFFARLALALPNQAFPFFPLVVQREALAILRTIR